MNGERYCELLQRKVVPIFTRNSSMIFQQDGAPPHYYRPAQEILDKDLPGRCIGRKGPTEWPARSPGLTVCEHVYTSGTNFRSIQRTRTQNPDDVGKPGCYTLPKCL